MFEQSRRFPHMDEPARFARVALRFLNSTELAPIDRAQLRERLAAHNAAVLEQIERERTEQAGA